MMRHRFVVLTLVAWAAFVGCTNDYEDFAYVSEPGGPTTSGGPNQCNFNGQCDADEQCVGGSCRCGGAPACGPGDTCCLPQGCVDLDDDPNNCGMCDNDCPMGSTCNNGSCMP